MLPLSPASSIVITIVLMLIPGQLPVDCTNTGLAVLRGNHNNMSAALRSLQRSPSGHNPAPA